MEKRKEFLPYARPFYDNNEIDGVVDAIKSNWWTTGTRTAEFEKEFAASVGAKYALALNSCTAGLHLSLLADGIGAGDEVITTPMTFCSTVNTIVHTGATPVFVDIHPDTGLINEDLIEDAITERTKAIRPVHYAGQCCNMDKIMQIAKKHNLLVHEDAAHAYASFYDGKPIGALGNATSFSFYVTKNIATGEGGMLTSNDGDFIERARIMSLHGMNHNAWNRYGAHGSWRYDVEYAGYKYNMTDIAAAMGLAQIKKVEFMQNRRKKYAEYLNNRFKDLKCIKTNSVAPKSVGSEHLYIIRVLSDELTIDRDEFITKLNNDYNIGTSVHFCPVHLFEFYKNKLGTKEGDFPETEKYFSQIISLPFYPSMTEEDIEYVADAVCEIAERYSK